MKRITISSKLLTIMILAGLFILPSCRKNLLKQDPTTDLPAASFWQTEADATYALLGAYAATRPVFDRDYYFSGHGEYTRVRGTSATAGNLQRGDAYQGANYDPTGYGDEIGRAHV